MGAMGTGSPPMPWADIYRAHGGAMLAAARGVLGSFASDKEALGKSAEDVVGDVIEELMTKGIPASVKNVRGFLTTAVRRRAVDHLRRTRFETASGPAFDELEGLDGIEQAVDLAADTDSALAALPAHERHAVEQRVMLQRPAKDVGDELGVSPQRVSQLVNAALARLRGHSAFIGSARDDRDPPEPSAKTDPDATGTTG